MFAGLHPLTSVLLPNLLLYSITAPSQHLLVCAAALVLLLLEVIPLAAHLIVLLEFGITLGVNKANVDEGTLQSVEHNRKNALALLLGLHSHQQQVNTLRTFEE